MTPIAEPEDVELLSFRLGDQNYCVEITTVREIRGWTAATPLPHAPACMEGVINLRGTVLPVIDLSRRLGMTPIVQDQRNVIIVVQNGESSLGLLVDAVSDILTVPRTSMQTPPAIGDDRPSGVIRALTLVGGDLVRVLDVSALSPGMKAA